MFLPFDGTVVITDIQKYYSEKYSVPFINVLGYLLMGRIKFTIF
jgi:hypothetical protein